MSTLTPNPVTASTTSFVIDTDHSEVGFSVRHMLSRTRGRFARFSGEIRLDRENPARSSVTFEVDPASIDTRQSDRDAHLRSGDFFDAEKFPALKFVSKKVEPGADGALAVQGTLEIRGVTKPVTLHVEPLSAAGKDPWGGLRRGTRATTKLNRKDFGLNWNSALELGGVLVGEEVEITLEIELIQK